MENTTKDLKTFEVGMWWYELHGGKVQVKATSEEEAIKIVEDNFNKYIKSLKKEGNTKSDMGDTGVDGATEVIAEAKPSVNMFEERFDEDVYVQTTTGSYYDGNVLELGKVIYNDYEPQYNTFKFTSGKYYSDRSYYNLGACPSRKRGEVLFEKGDFRKLLFRKIEEKCALNKVATNMDELLSGEREVLTLQMNFSEDSDNPRTIQVATTKVYKHTARIPYRANFKDHVSVNISSSEKLVEMATAHRLSRVINDSYWSFFLNTPEHINELVSLVERMISYTLCKSN